MICRFLTWHNLRGHIKTIHKGNKEYKCESYGKIIHKDCKCESCGNHFTQASFLRRHQYCTKLL